MANEAESAALDCSTLSLSQVLGKLRESPQDATIRLTHVDEGWHGFGSGDIADTTFEIDGQVGDFAFMLAQKAHWKVRGSVGRSCGHSLETAEIVISGNAGACTGAFAKGGFIAVLGKAGISAGYCLNGGELVIRSLCGDRAGNRMRGGVLVLANGAGEALGHDMQGGNIFLRGKAKSISQHARMVRMKDADALRLSLLLARAGINGNVKEFKLYSARKSS